MEAKLCKIENSLGIILPDEMLAHLQVVEGDSVILVKKANGGLQLVSGKTPLGESLRVGLSIMARYPNTLHALSD
ncbi:MAG TPA: AbrB/MazE/SpoVT family DNA-binding domain-containing protein [Verrucomicrobiales bacterium]|nr:AbrB/MazE/SpoVT family DNA-binding domain-containing protein [Verrucomicrobiales bacterium]